MVDKSVTTRTNNINSKMFCLVVQYCHTQLGFKTDIDSLQENIFSNDREQGDRVIRYSTTALNTILPQLLSIDLYMFVLVKGKHQPWLTVIFFNYKHMQHCYATKHTSLFLYV